MPRQRGMGRPSLFGERFGVKLRNPVTLTLSQRHHDKLAKAVRRLSRAVRERTPTDPTRRLPASVTRADVLALLIECYADVVVLPPER